MAADSDDDMRQTLEAVLEAFNAHDLDRIIGFLVADCVLEMPRGPDPWGTRHKARTPVSEDQIAIKMSHNSRLAWIQA